MSEIFLARQPVYDTHLAVGAYELFYRDSETNSANIVDRDAATSRVVVNTLTEIGLENVVGERLALIKVTRDFVLAGGLDGLESSRLVFEVISDIAVDQPYADALMRLRQRGRRFALDDYLGSEPDETLLPAAEFVKIDLLITPPEKVEALVERLRPLGVALIAERVETEQQFESCRKLGFAHFQGYYFSRPKVMKFQSLPTSQLAMVQLLGRLSDPDSRLEDVEDAVALDVSLSYKLLRHINSAYYGLHQEVESIAQAVQLVGLPQIRRWATLISLANVDEYSNEAANTALVRAKMCETLANSRDPALADRAFTVGLLSVLDLVLHASMEQILHSLPIAADVRAALTDRQGALGEVLDCTLAYEHGEWSGVERTGFDATVVSDAYFDAVKAALHASMERM